MDGFVADVHQRRQGVRVEVGQLVAQGFGQVLARPAGAIDAHQLAQRQLVEGLPAADLLLRLDELFLPRRRRLAEQLVVQLDQQALQRAGGGLDGLGVVFLLEEGFGFGQGLRIVHVALVAQDCGDGEL